MDLVANGLKSVFGMNTRKEKKLRINEQDDRFEPQSVQELYRKVHANDTKHGQEYADVTDFGDCDDTPKRSVYIQKYLVVSLSHIYKPDW